ncbi:hypothetical protein D3C86_2096960 [compost metagenome]
MINRQSNVFIQIVGRRLGEADDAFGMHFHQLGIDANRRASGSKAQHSLGIALQQADNQARSGLREIFITCKLQNIH